MFTLPDPLYSWAWQAAFLKQQAEANEFESTAGGILLPTKQFVDDRPALAHFSHLLSTGVERSWLWLFPFPAQAVALRMLPAYCPDPGLELISDTLPQPPPRELDPCYLQMADIDYLRSLPLPEMEIHEVWIGFSFKKYKGDRNLRLCADAVMESAEFLRVAQR